jgi:hypothetical protein
MAKLTRQQLINAIIGSVQEGGGRSPEAVARKIAEKFKDVLNRLSPDATDDELSAIADDLVKSLNKGAEPFAGKVAGKKLKYGAADINYKKLLDNVAKEVKDNPQGTKLMGMVSGKAEELLMYDKSPVRKAHLVAQAQEQGRQGLLKSLMADLQKAEKTSPAIQTAAGAAPAAEGAAGVGAKTGLFDKIREAYYTKGRLSPAKAIKTAGPVALLGLLLQAINSGQEASKLGAEAAAVNQQAQSLTPENAYYKNVLPIMMQQLAMGAGQPIDPQAMMPPSQPTGLASEMVI